MPDGSPRSETPAVAPVERLKPRQESLPKRGEPYALEFDRSIAAVEALLERSQVQADKREEARTLANTWRKRSERDSQAAGKEMTADAYTLAIRNFTRKLGEAVTPDEKKKAQYGVDYYTESLRQLNEVEAKKAELEKGSPEGRANLYKAYTEHPAAVRSFFFQKALNTWKLQPEVKKYGEAVLARERAKEVYVHAQQDWYAKNCGEAYTSLKERQKALQVDADGLESWEVAIYNSVSDGEDLQNWRKTNQDRRLGYFGGNRRKEFIDPQALQEREETFRELHPELFEVLEQTYTKLHALREPLALRISKDETLKKELVRYDVFRANWKDERFAGTWDTFAKDAVESTKHKGWGDILAKADPEFNTALTEVQQAGRVIYEAKQKMLRQMEIRLQAEHENLQFAGKQLEAFEAPEREQVLASLKTQLIQAEQRVAECVQQNGREVNLFLWRTGNLLFEHSYVGSERLLAGRTRAHVEQGLKDTEHSYPGDYQPVYADSSVRQQKNLLESQERLQRITEALLQKAKSADLSRLSYDSLEVMKSVQDVLLGGKESRTIPDGLYSLSSRGVSLDLQSPLTEVHQITAFGKLLSSLEEDGLNATLLEGARKCGQSLNTLATLLIASPERELQQVGLSLDGRYASVIKLVL